MEQYAGLDVSLESTSVCVVDSTGRVIREPKVLSEPEALITWFQEHGTPLTRIGLEAGPLSQLLYAAMESGGLPVELLETRHVRAALTIPSASDGRCPVLGVADHGIENGEEFSGAGSEGNLGRFSSVLEAFAESTEGRVVSSGDEACEVLGSPDVGSPSPDVALAAKGAGVAGVGAKSSEACDPPVVKLAEFRQASDQDSGQGGADTGNGDEAAVGRDSGHLKPTEIADELELSGSGTL